MEILRAEAVAGGALTVSVLRDRTGLFLMVNLLYIPTLEEPQLEQRFGDDYRDYKRNVPRFIPRLTGFSNDRSSD